jgi:WD40 repeat protein
VWHADSFELKGFLFGHTDRVTGLCFTTDGSSRLISCSDDATVRIWDMEVMEEIRCLPQRDYVTSVSINAANDHIVCLVGSHEVYIWDITPDYKPPILMISDCGSNSESYWFIGNDKIVGCHRNDHELAVWDAYSGAELQVATCPEDRIFLLSMHPQGIVLACVMLSRSIVLWDINTMQYMKTLRAHKLMPADIRFSFDGLKLVSGGGDRYLNIWSVSSGLLLASIIVDFGIRSVTFTADGTKVLAVLYDGTAKIHDAENGNEVITLAQAGFEMCEHACVSPSTYVLM